MFLPKSCCNNCCTGTFNLCNFPNWTRNAPSHEANSNHSSSITEKNQTVTASVVTNQPIKKPELSKAEFEELETQL